MLIVINRSMRCVAIVTLPRRVRVHSPLKPHSFYPAVTRSHARSPLVVMDPDANEKEIESTSTLDAHRRGRRRLHGRARETTRSGVSRACDVFARVLVRVRVCVD